MKIFVVLASMMGAMSVATGAFGAHGLQSRVDERMLEIWETAARYQMYHALALFAVAWLVSQTQATSASVAGWSFFVGTLIFSGSLYIMVLSGMKWLGAITPIGGTILIVGWICCLVAALQSSFPN